MNGIAYPHPNSPAGRYLTAQDIRLPALPERVESVVRAYLQALRLAPEAVYQETGYQLDQIKEGLLPGLLQMLAILGISVVAGTAAGTAIGFFLGGVGAAPGAVVGAELGLEIGIAVLTWLGLGFLAVAIGQGMGELTSVLRRGIHRAWLAPEHHHPQFEIDRAAEDLARAEGILFRLILQGLLAYVLKNGAVSASQAVRSTGQTIARSGTRAAADETLAEVSALLLNSKLPEEFVVWIERNWEDLKRNPKLSSNKTGPTVSSQASSSAATPSELKAMKERLGREDIGENSGNKSQPVMERTTHEKAAFGERSSHDRVTGKDYSNVPDNTASSIHQGRLAAESGRVSQESILRALRQSGSVEGAATAKLMKRGNVKINLVATDPWKGGAAGRAPFGSDTVYLSLDKLPSPTSAAGVAAHETRHVLQKLTPQSYRRVHELEAYQWQRAVDPAFNLSDDAITRFIQTHPIYRNVPPSMTRGQ